MSKAQITDLYGRVPETGDIIVAIWRQRALCEARVNGVYSDIGVQVEWLGVGKSERAQPYSNLRTSTRFVIVKTWDDRFPARPLGLVTR